MDWLKPRLRDIGKTAAALARALNIDKARVYEMQRGDRRLQADEIEPAARFLEMSPSELMALLSPAGAKSASQSNGQHSVSGGTFHRANVSALSRDTPPHYATELARDVPVLGVVSGGRGTLQMNGEPIDYVRRPKRFEGRSDLAAARVEDLSMAPRYEPGELIYFERMRLPKNGEYGVIEIKDDPHEPPKALLKKIVKQTSKAVTVEQFNPPKTFDIPRSQIVRLHRVTPLDDLLGF